MKSIVITTTLVCIGLIIFGQAIVHISYAAIDRESAIGIWLLDEGQGDVAKDISGNGNDGKLVDAQWVEGKFGKGLEFDGISHLEIPPSETTDDYLDGFTYLLWVKPTGSPPNANTRLIERDWHNPTIQISSAGNFYASTVVGGAIDRSAVIGGAWEIEEWSFVALTYDGTTLKLYVDGEMVQDLKAGRPDFTKAHAGGAIWLATWKAPGWDFKGVLDEVAVFSVALSIDDINSIMNAGLESISAVSYAGKIATTWGRCKRQQIIP